MDPLTNEQIWGVPDDELPDDINIDLEVCPIIDEWCVYYDGGHCRALECAWAERMEIVDEGE